MANDIAEQEALGVCNIVILVLILCIIGAEIMALIIFSPQQFKFKATEANITILQVRASHDRALPTPNVNESFCDRIYEQVMSGTETIMWQLEPCLLVADLDPSVCIEESRRASATGGKLRFAIITGRDDESPGASTKETLPVIGMVTAITELPSTYGSLMFANKVAALETGTADVFLDAPAKLREGFAVLAIER